jgi:hypothetical protein
MIGFIIAGLIMFVVMVLWDIFQEIEIVKKI